MIEDQRAAEGHLGTCAAGCTLGGALQLHIGGGGSHLDDASFEGTASDRVETSDQWKSPASGGPGVVVGHLPQWQCADQGQGVGRQFEQF